MVEQTDGDGITASALRRDAAKARALGLTLGESNRKEMEMLAERLEREAIQLEIAQRPWTSLDHRRGF